jgi:hypothetical protein
MLILECKQGELQNGKMIAVKKFKPLTNPVVQEMQFTNEVFPLMSLRHPNIVRCVGYCFNASRIIVQHNENYIIAESPKMLLCFEYLTMGSLDKHLKGMAIEPLLFFKLLGFQNRAFCDHILSANTIYY